MSRKLLSNLNGANTGLLNQFLNEFIGEPRIAWYPSAGEDFRALVYLHPNFSQLHPATAQEPRPPDLFLFTDYYPWSNSNFLDNTTIYEDERTTVFIESMEELPRLNLKLHDELVSFPEGSIKTDRAFFLKIQITSNLLGNITFPVLYAFAENETFYSEKIIPNKAIFSHIIHVRYGSSFGGGKATGIWILNVLKQLKCELFITDSQYSWQQGDWFALRLCPTIPKDSDAQLTPIRVIQSRKWSGSGSGKEVSWNLIS